MFFRLFTCCVFFENDAKIVLLILLFKPALRAFAVNKIGLFAVFRVACWYVSSAHFSKMTLCFSCELCIRSLGVSFLFHKNFVTFVAKILWSFKSPFTVSFNKFF